MYKRGLSTVVATLLTILITLVAVGVVWVVVRNIIQGGSEQVSLGKFSLDLEIKNIARDTGGNSMSVDIKRNVGEGELSGLMFISESESNVEIFNITGLSLEQLEERIFDINLSSSMNVTELEKVSVAPIFILESGKEVVGDIADEYFFTSPNPLPQESCADTCLSLGYGCGIQNVCEILTNCGNCLTGYECNSTGQCNLVLPPTWKPDFTINKSLPNVTFVASSVFYKDSNWYLIGGGVMQVPFPGFIWNSSSNQWRPDSAINKSLPTSGMSYTSTDIFYKDLTWYALTGNYDANFLGFAWNGTNWRPNSTINASLTEMYEFTWMTTPSVFQKDGTWYMLAGEYYGGIYGFAWNGTNWRPNSTINASLIDLGGRTTPEVFYKDSSLYLISGNNLGNFYGYVWDSSLNQWRTNSTIIDGLSTMRSVTAPSVFYKDSSWYMITSEERAGGEDWFVYGFAYN